MIFRRFWGSLVPLVAVALSFGQTTPPPAETPAAPAVAEMTPTAAERAVLMGEITTILRDRAFVPGMDFSDWPKRLEAMQGDFDAAVTQESFVGLMNQALRQYGISHARFLSPRAATNRTRTSVVGLGISGGRTGDGFTIARVFEGSAAADLGLKQGDVVVTVNGEAAERAQQFQGEDGASLTLVVRRMGATETETLTATLRPFSIVRKETLVWLDEKTAVLRVFTFSAGYGRDVIEAHMKEAAKAENLILDLRSNGGGASGNLNHLLSLLLPNGSPYGVFASRSMVQRWKDAHPGQEFSLETLPKWEPATVKTRERTVPPFRGRLAVLINRGSGSASEVAAQSLKEYGAVVAGQPSAGAVLASIFVPLSFGYQIQIPVSDYVSQMGVRLEKSPVKPTVPVEVQQQPGETDPVVAAAWASLRDGAGQIQATASPR